MPTDLAPITAVERAELAPYVEMYQAALPEFVEQAVEAGAFDDCVDATRRLIPVLAQGGPDKLPALAAVALIALAQAWRREERAS
jgi:hypothetical protein